MFDFSCLIVLCDAACCTKNYIDYDEPRWSRDKTTTLCAQLRTLEVTLGDDRRILRQAAEAVQAQRPDFAALLGSPVPAIVGMDLAGMARELEEQTGIPALGLETTGFSAYRRGIELAQTALFRRFADSTAPKLPRTVNLLGVTPLDFGARGGAAALRAAVERAGFSVQCSFSMDCTLDQVRRCAGAAGNLVVSASGLALAREMERTLGIPYTAFVPMGEEIHPLKELLEQMQETGVSQLPADHGPSRDGPGLLIVGDQVMAHSVRLALRRLGVQAPIHVGSFFGLDPALAAPGDLRLDREADLIRALRSGRYAALIGDPLLEGIPDTAGLHLIPLPHPAVSGPLHWDEVSDPTGAEFSALLAHAAAVLV